VEGFTYIILEGDYLRLVFDALKLRNFQKKHVRNNSSDNRPWVCIDGSSTD